MREKKTEHFLQPQIVLRSIYLIDLILSFLSSMHEKMPNLENRGK